MLRPPRTGRRSSASMLPSTSKVMDVGIFRHRVGLRPAACVGRAQPSARQGGPGPTTRPPRSRKPSGSSRDRMASASCPPDSSHRADSSILRTKRGSTPSEPQRWTSRQDQSGMGTTKEAMRWVAGVPRIPMTMAYAWHLPRRNVARRSRCPRRCVRRHAAHGRRRRHHSHRTLRGSSRVGMELAPPPRQVPAPSWPPRWFSSVSREDDPAVEAGREPADVQDRAGPPTVRPGRTWKC